MGEKAGSEGCEGRLEEGWGVKDVGDVGEGWGVSVMCWYWLFAGNTLYRAVWEERGSPRLLPQHGAVQCTRSHQGQGLHDGSCGVCAGGWDQDRYDWGRVQVGGAKTV